MAPSADARGRQKDVRKASNAPIRYVQMSMPRWGCQSTGKRSGSDSAPVDRVGPNRSHMRKGSDSSVVTAAGNGCMTAKLLSPVGYAT